MNQVSASALDLLASALAAILLLYIVTLQEILVYPIDIKTKSVRVTVKIENSNCRLLVAFQKGSDFFLPNQFNDFASITPAQLGAQKYNITLSYKQQPEGKIMIILHNCPNDEIPSLSSSITINVIAVSFSVYERRIHFSPECASAKRNCISITSPMIQCSLQNFEQGKNEWTQYE